MARRAKVAIAEAVAKKIRRSKRNIFMREDFAALGSYGAVGVALRQALASGSLVRIGHGLYAKAERSPITGRPAPIVGIQRLAREALARVGRKTVLSSHTERYNQGVTRQVPTGRVVRVLGRVRRRIGYDGVYVVFERITR